MNKGYFDKKAEENKTTLLKMCLSLVQGLIRITTISIDKTAQDKQYRAVIFFEKKGDK
jgi:hypothetical protein